MQSMTTVNAARMRELLPLAPGAPSYNSRATQWRHVFTDVRYVKDPDSSVDGPLADQLAQHLGVLHLEYLLEMDARGRIIGGEWLGDSKTEHPDFTWMPVRAPRSASPFSWTHLKTLVRELDNG